MNRCGDMSKCVKNKIIRVIALVVVAVSVSCNSEQFEIIVRQRKDIKI